MSSCLARNGYVSLDELKATPGVPSLDRMQRGPVAVLECVQEIPCNPCEAACPRHAIHVGTPITNRPALDEKKCTGCALCVTQCPGLAIFVVDLSGSGKTARVTLPYEYLPLPKVGDAVDVVDRSGEVVGTGSVLQVVTARASDRTAAVTVEVAREQGMNARGIRMRGGDGNGAGR